MRKFHIASLLLLSGSLAFACNGDGSDDDGDTDGMGGNGATTSTGGSGATTSTGGTGGDGTMATGACSDDEKGTNVAEGTCNMINDFEGDEFMASFDQTSDGREGAGIDMDGDTPRLSGGDVGDDDLPTGEGTLEVVNEGANGTDQSVKFTFSGAEQWGGAFSHLLSNGPCYDAGAYDGIKFYAKADPGSNKEIFLMVSTADGNPLYDCSEEDEEAGLCYDSPRTTITLTEDWAEYTVEWGDLMPPGWGTTESFEVSRTLALIFADAGVAETNDITFYVDEIAFMGGDDSMCGEGESGMGGMGGGGS